MSRVEKALNYFFTFIVFIIVILVLGALFPQYLGVASQIVIDNISTLATLAVIGIIIYLIIGWIEERWNVQDGDSVQSHQKC